MLTFFRACLFNLFFYGWGLLLCIILLPALILPRQVTVAINRFYEVGISWIETYILGLTYDMRGLENLPDGPCIIAMKHQSAWETFKLHLWFKDPIVVLKQELLHIPIWGAFLKKIGVIAIDRAGGAKTLSKMIAEAEIALANGRSIVIFPQGTRVKPGEFAPYKIGVGKLASSLKMPVIPVWLDSGLYWPKDSFVKKSGRIFVEIRPAIDPNQGIREFMKALESALEN